MKSLVRVSTMSANLQIFDRGFSLRHSVSHLSREKKGGGKRGCLDGSYSSASFRRLREFVVRFSVPDSECWGITLTVPGLELLSTQEFKSLHHRLVLWCNYRKLPIVWRVELQRRKMPHLHCVCYCSLLSVLFLFSKWFYELGKLYCFEVVDGDFLRVSRNLARGSCHSVDLQRLSGGFDAFRYLVNHMSKSKQEQLGWAGRNWGVLNKFKFCPDDGVNFPLYDFEYYSLVRWLRRLTRRRIFSRGCSFWVTDPILIRRMYNYIVECERIPGGAEGAVRDSGARRLHWVWSSFCLAFLSSIPDSYFDSVLEQIKRDSVRCFLEFNLWYLTLCVYYFSFGRKSESFKLLDCDSSLNESENY